MKIKLTLKVETEEGLGWTNVDVNEFTSLPLNGRHFNIFLESYIVPMARTALTELIRERADGH